jgi:hypothetical protein
MLQYLIYQYMVQHGIKHESVWWHPEAELQLLAYNGHIAWLDPS